MALHFELYGFKINYSNEQETYNNIRKMYDSLADTAQTEFEKWYSECGSLDSFIEKGKQTGYRYISLAVDCTIDILVKSNVYNMSQEKLEEEYGEYYLRYWFDAFDKVNDQYMEIVLNSEQLDAYRTARRQSRGRFVGGGFGMSGAMKGMMTAGALNMATGAVHGAVNLVGKGLTAIGNAMKKSSIYNDSSTKEDLSWGLWKSVFRLHDILCDILDIETLPIDSEKSEAILSNLPRLDNQEKMKEMLVNCLYLNPYNTDAYKFAIYGFPNPLPDENGDLQKFAECFGRGDYLYRLKIKWIQSLIEEKNQFFSSSEVVCLLEKIEKMKKIYYITDELPEENKFKRIYEELELKERTVEGIIFETQSEANSAKLNKQTALNLYSTIDQCTYDEVISVKNQIISLFTETGVQLVEAELSEIDKKIDQLDIERRSFQGIVFDTVEKKEKAVTDMEKVNEVLKNSVWNDWDNLKALVEKQKIIQNMGIEPLLFNKVSRELDEKIHEIELTNKVSDLDTYFSKINLNSFTNTNYENAKNAYQQILKEFDEETIANSRSAKKVKAFISEYERLSSLSKKYQSISFNKLREILKQIYGALWRTILCFTLGLFGGAFFSFPGFFIVIIVFGIIFRNGYKKKLRQPYLDSLQLLREGKEAYEILHTNSICCSKCGNAIKEGSVFCGNCGELVDDKVNSNRKEN